MRGGLTFSFMAMGATVGGLTEAFTVYFHKGGRWTRKDLVNMAFNFSVFGLLGVMNSGLSDCKHACLAREGPWEPSR